EGRHGRVACAVSGPHRPGGARHHGAGGSPLDRRASRSEVVGHLRTQRRPVARRMGALATGSAGGLLVCDRRSASVPGGVDPARARPSALAAVGHGTPAARSPIATGVCREVAASPLRRGANRRLLALACVAARRYSRIARARASGSRHPGMRTLDPQSLPQHVDRLYRAAWGLCGSREDAQDLVQETFARVLSRRRVLHGEDDLYSLMRVLRNTFLTGRRTAGRRPVTVATLEDVVTADPRPTGRPELALEIQEVYATIATLPEDF